MVDASVIIPTIGRPERLRACLESLAGCDPRPSEVVVVDQSETGDTAALVEEFSGLGARRVTCERRGVGHARNVGLVNARGQVALMTDDDCTVADSWVGEGVRLAREHPGALITGAVLAGEDSPMALSTKVDPAPWDYTGERTSGVLYTNNALGPRAELVAFGGFDERLPTAEDNDLCYRWLAEGRPLRYEPELVVWHHDWRTPEQLVRTHVAYARAQGAFYAKHLHAGDRRVLPLLRWDLRQGLRSTVVGLVRRTPRWQDPYREMVWSLLRGLAAGWLEARRLDPSPASRVSSGAG